MNIARSQRDISADWRLNRVIMAPHAQAEGTKIMKRTKANGIALCLALGAGLALAGPASAEVKFGIGGPLTGGSAAFGAQLKNGTEQAIADVNAAGGILGQKLTSELGDDRADPKEGVSVANKFVGDGV